MPDIPGEEAAPGGPLASGGDLPLGGVVAVVTGASRGIGLAVAGRLVADGARVCLTARRPEPLAEAVAALGGPEHAVAVAGRADDPEHRGAAVRAATDAFGPVTLLVNNAGINPVAGPLIELDLAAVQKTFQVNVVGALGWAQEVCHAGMADRGGVIVNVASVAGLHAAPGLGAYGASKAALIHLTAGLARELAPRVRVVGVAPAVVRTRFAEALYQGREAEVAARYPLGRLGDPQDVAGAVAFLASEAASWITGQTLVLDGGMLLTGGLG